VPERVEIYQTFATRDLVRGLARTPRFRVLALGEKPSRLLEGSGTVLIETAAPEFPIFVEGARGEPLASGGPAVHSSRPEAQHLAFFRQVDDALASATAKDPLPLVVAGTERDLAYFADVTEHAGSIIGQLAGNHEDTAPDQLALLALPLVEHHAASQRAAVIAELVEAIGPGRGIVGLEAAWDATLQGRARILLVEEDFVYPARLVDGRLEPADDPDAPGVVDDAVDELIEQVLERSGDVVIVGSGELGEHGPAALLLRF
jgi:hypothetical protein